MGSYTVAHGEIGVHEKTLVASTIDTVTFAVGDSHTVGWAGAPKTVEVITDGAENIYVTADGSDPVVAGAGCVRMPAWPGSLLIDVSGDGGNPVVVKLISAGSATYSVSRAE